MSLNIEEIKAKLRKNIEFVKKYISDFNPTEEQINNYLSPERLAAYEKYKDLPKASNVSSAKYQKAVSYIPGKIVPKEFARVAGPLANTDPNQEAEAYNQKTFADLMRDDEIGERTRQDMFLKCINSAVDFDFEKMGEDVPLAEKLEYAYQQRMQGLLAFNFTHVTQQTPTFAIKDTARANILKKYSEDIGAVLSAYPDYAGSPGFLEFPGELMTDEQITIFKALSQGSTPLAEELRSRLDGESILQAADMANRVIPSIRVLPQSIASYKKDYLEKGYGKFAAEDIEFKEKDPAKRTMGGYSSRVNAMFDLAKKLAELTEQRQEPAAKNLRDAARNWIRTMEQMSPLPGENDVQVIIAATSALSLSCVAYKKDKTIDHNAPGEAEFFRAIDALNNTKKGLDNEESLRSLIGYQKADSALYAQADSYQLMEKNLKELNEDMRSYLVKDAFGNDQLLTADDLSELGMKMTAVLKHANDYLDNVPEGTPEAFLNNVKLSVQRMNLMLRGVNHALPGQTLKDVLDGGTRQIDVTGHKFKVYGNVLSGRQKMNLTAPDGSIVTGFFTKRMTLDRNYEIGRLTSLVKEQYPALSEKIDELQTLFLTDPSSRRVSEFEETFLEGQPEKSPLRKMYATYRSGMKTIDAAKANYMGMIMDMSDAPIDTRNVAMSDVADMLGIGNLIARSVPLEIYDNGVKTEGTFMALAEGEAMDRINKDSKLLKTNFNSLDNSEALRQIADIQVLDYICGNIDRHGANLIYQVNDDGKITGVTGIDNDMAFGTFVKERAAHIAVPEEMRFVSRSMAERVRALSPEMLKTALVFNKLAQPSIDAALERLAVMKEALADGTVQIMADEEFKNHPLTDFLKADKSAQPGNYPYEINRNLFGKFISESKARLTDAAKEKFKAEREAAAQKQKEAKPEAQQEEAPDMVDTFERLDQTVAKQDIRPMDELLEAMNGAQRNVYFGSPQFDRVVEELQKMRDASELIGKNDKLATRTVYEGLQQGYAALKAKCDEYLARKQRQGKLEAGGKTGRRIEAVKRVMAFANNKIDSIHKLLTPELTKEEEIRQMKAESDKLQMEAFDKDHKLVGDFFRGMKDEAFKEGKLSKVHVQVAEELKLIGKYMNDRKLSPQECGLTTEDMGTINTMMKMGRLANAGSNKNVADFQPAQNNKAPDKKAKLSM